MNSILKKPIPIIYGNRREKDIEVSISNTNKLHRYIKWKPKYNNLKFILRSSYEWEKKMNYIKKI
jgi:UDP-glucose 4-epimerase